MDAAKLVRVPDSISRGVNALPEAGDNGGQIAKNTYPASGLESPKPAANSGKTLDNSMLGATNAVSNGQGRQYTGKDDAKVANTSSSMGGSFTPSAADDTNKL